MLMRFKNTEISIDTYNVYSKLKVRHPKFGIGEVVCITKHLIPYSYCLYIRYELPSNLLGNLCGMCENNHGSISSSHTVEFIDIEYKDKKRLDLI